MISITEGGTTLPRYCATVTIRGKLYQKNLVCQNLSFKKKVKQHWNKIRTTITSVTLFMGASHAEQDVLRQTSYGFALAVLLLLELHRKVRERSD